MVVDLGRIIPTVTTRRLLVFIAAKYLINMCRIPVRKRMVIKPIFVG